MTELRADLKTIRADRPARRSDSHAVEARPASLRAGIQPRGGAVAIAAVAATRRLGR